MKTNLHVAMVVVSAGLGCNGSPLPAEPAPPERQSQAVTASSEKPSSIVGYAHTLDKSKFKIGSGPSDQSASGFLKVVGSDGVFAVDSINGSAAGIANAGAPTGTFTLSASAHEARVLSYFTSAGIPSDQIGEVTSTVSATGGGKVIDPDVPTKATSIQYTSIVERRIQGILVAESHAWARFDDNDDVVAEDVYWPALPTAALDEALAIAAYLKDARKEADYRAKLPAAVASAEGRVVIRHSALTERGSFVARGCYDVFVKSGEGQSGYVTHFGVDGSEISLPQESRTLPETPRERK